MSQSGEKDSAVPVPVLNLPIASGGGRKATRGKGAGKGRLVLIVLVVGLLAFASGFAVNSGVDVPPPALIAVPDPPDRSAAEDEALRQMAIDLVVGRTCDLLEGRFAPLPEDLPDRPRDALPVTTGRLRVDECEASQEDGNLSLRVAGEGWQWTDRTGDGPIGSSVRVRGTVRMHIEIELAAQVDLRYQARAHRTLGILTPLAAPEATVRATGSIPVQPDGDWSAIPSAVMSMLLGDPTEQARPIFERLGADQVRRQLGGGGTLVMDLCGLQPDFVLGPLGDDANPPERPYPSETVWLENGRNRLGPGGLDLAGPFESADGLDVDLTVESGGPLTLALLCRAQGEALATDYLGGGPSDPASGLVEATAEAEQPVSMALEAGRCDEAMLVVAAASTNPAVTDFTVRVAPADAPDASLFECP